MDQGLPGSQPTRTRWLSRRDARDQCASMNRRQFPEAAHATTIGDRLRDDTGRDSAAEGLTLACVLAVYQQQAFAALNPHRFAMCPIVQTSGRRKTDPALPA